MTRRPVSGRTGFTLVELLVVIGIIVVLVSLLLPTLGRVRTLSASTTCLSNLRQIGVLTLAYASEHEGYLMPCRGDSISGLPAMSHKWVNKHLNNPADPTQPNVPHAPSIKMFFCPSNELPRLDGSSMPSPQTFGPGPNAARMLYWYMGNPVIGPGATPDFTARAANTWLDVTAEGRPVPGGNGTNRDEYIRNINEKNPALIAIATDESRRESDGWFMLHGTGGGKTVKNSWKNNLYGDGRVESVRPDQVIARWGPNFRAAW